MRSYTILCEVPASFFIEARSITEAVEAFEHSDPSQFVQKPLSKEMITEIWDSKGNPLTIPTKEKESEN